MASATRHLSRAALLYTRRISARRKTRWPVAQTRVSIPKVRSQFAPISATFTTSRFLRQQDEEDDEEEDEEDEEDEDEDSGKIRIGNPSLEGIKNFLDTLSPEERAEFEEESLLLEKEFMSPEFEAEMDADVDAIDKDIEKQTPNLTFPDVKPHPRYQGVWGDEEEDEFAQTEDGDDDYKDDEMTSIAHAQLELHREMREYARIAAWDMPLLSSKCSHPLSILRSSFHEGEHFSNVRSILRSFSSKCPSTTTALSKANVQPQNYPNPSPHPSSPNPSASVTQPTWANRTPQNAKSFSKSAAVISSPPRPAKAP